ncbi:hypothetical protein ACFS5J_00265 [Flavobacterium chuncheonense]|uniref:Lipoprotein n=1 Tax=Flavobacterium chuncheonense TaxID=2026653 RepID=A0ABW5YHG3_9FLAO
MSKKILIIILLSLFICSCKKRQEKIEIYLLENSVSSDEGIPLVNYLKIKKMPYDPNRINKNYNYDSIKKQMIYGGKFSVDKTNLQALPIIEDKDILKFNLSRSELILTKRGQYTLSFLDKNINQFAICVDGNPILTGYFRYNYSSVIYSWNYIGYNYYKDKEKLENPKFVIFHNLNYSDWKPVLTNLEDYPKLLQAFEKSGRLQR